MSSRTGPVGREKPGGGGQGWDWVSQAPPGSQGPFCREESVLPQGVEPCGC